MASRLARAVPRFSTIVTRSFSAAASAEAQASHAPEASEELKLIFAAPDRVCSSFWHFQQLDLTFSLENYFDVRYCEGWTFPKAKKSDRSHFKKIGHV